MSQITHACRIGLMLVVMITALAGCGTPTNEQVPFDVDEQGHSADWRGTKHAEVARVDTVSCQECHGGDLSGGISQVACSSCHVNGISVLTGCTSCHGNPPSGSTAPNRSGAHAVHYAVLPAAANGCGSCHSGAGSGSIGLHNDGLVNVSFLSVFSAKSGTATMNADGTCSKVSCHGGQTTPAWLSGTTIDVNTQCASCHAFGGSEYNSFVSGMHDMHVVNLNLFCAACHNTTTLAASHFTTLNTTTMEGPAAATVGTAYITYDAASGSCTTICHDIRYWNE